MAAERRCDLLRLRFEDQTTTTRSTTLAEPIVGGAEIYSVLQTLLERLGEEARSVHTVGITLAGLTVSGEDERQLELFSPSA